MADLSSRYILQTLLGSGCSAGVFTAVDASRSERVAVKLTTRRPGMRWRSMLATYEREALLLRQCAHRNIVPCIDVLTSDRSCAIVLGLCPGGDCQQLVQRHGALAERAALHIAQQLCAALAFMHGRRVIHRDVKLDNVCVCNLGFTGLPHVQLCDFGHACHLDGACAGMTRCACEGVCVGSVDDGFRGTHGYAPPEVERGTGWSTSADVWSAGVVLYALLANELLRWKPNSGVHAPEVSTKTSRAFAQVSTVTKMAIKSVLQPQPADRASLAAFAAALAASLVAIEQPTTCSPTTAAEKPLQTAARGAGTGTDAGDTPEERHEPATQQRTQAQAVPLRRTAAGLVRAYSLLSLPGLGESSNPSAALDAASSGTLCGSRVDSVSAAGGSGGSGGLAASGGKPPPFGGKQPPSSALLSLQRGRYSLGGGSRGGAEEYSSTSTVVVVSDGDSSSSSSIASSPRPPRRTTPTEESLTAVDVCAENLAEVVTPGLRTEGTGVGGNGGGGNGGGGNGGGGGAPMVEGLASTARLATALTGMSLHRVPSTPAHIDLSAGETAARPSSPASALARPPPAPLPPGSMRRNLSMPHMSVPLTPSPSPSPQKAEAATMTKSERTAALLARMNAARERTMSSGW